MKPRPFRFPLFLILFLFFAILPAPAFSEVTAPSPGDTLTLARAKQIALENSPTPAAALERLRQAREDVAQARAQYLPTLSANSGVNYTEATGNTSPGLDETLYTARVSITQTLFDGFYRKYASLGAGYGEKMSWASLEDARRFLAWSVAQGFLNVQLAMENMAIAGSDMEFNREQEADALAREQAGTGSYSDVLNFKTKVNQAQSSLFSAEQDLKESLHGLAALMGFEDGCLPRGMVVAPLEFKQDDTAGSDELSKSRIQDLLAQRPDLKRANLAVEQARSDVGMAKASFFPTISLTGGYGTTAGDGFDDTDSMGASLGLNVSFDLFTGGTRKSQVRQAMAKTRELEQDMAGAKITAVSEIRSSAGNILTARKQYVLEDENARLVRTARDLVKQEYRAGQVSLVRLNQAQNDLVNAMGSLAKARISLVLALEEFDYYTGDNVN